MQVRDVMTRGVVMVNEGAPLGDAINIMVGHKISGVPVVDGQTNLVGILTEGDLLRRTETGTGTHRPKWLDFLMGPGHSAADYVHTHSRRVDDLMTRDVASVTEDASLESVVGLMEHKHVKRVPVLRDGQVVGIVSRADLIRILARALDAVTSGARTDAAIRNRLEGELQGQSWYARNINISVEAGVVTLDGIIMDDRTRDALRVAAQNVPGVKTVQDQLVWVDPSSGITLGPR